MDALPTTPTPYRGRLAPSPTGLLHIGHAHTFWTAYQRSLEHGGTLVFRNEDLDPQRCKPEFARAMMEDLRWLGIRWQEGPDIGGPFAPYQQSRRRKFYLAVWIQLRDGGYHLSLHVLTQRPGQWPQPLPTMPTTNRMYPGRCRVNIGQASSYELPAGMNWRFRIPDGEESPSAI